MSLLFSVGPWVVVLAVLVGCSAFFSSSESAIFSLPAASGDGQTASPGDGEPGAAGGGGVSASGDSDADGSDDDAATATLADLRADPHRLLVTLLVGNNVVNVAISSIVTLLVARYLEPGASVAVATALAATLVLVLGEIVPKSYGLGRARTWSLRVARPIAVVERLLGPVVSVFDAVTRVLTRFVGGDADIEETYTE
jgi:Mg2+/Co2+ transporter CorB